MDNKQRKAMFAKQNGNNTKFLEFKDAKKIMSDVAKKKKLQEKINKNNWKENDLKNWWIRYTKTKEFKRLYGDKVPNDPWNYYSKENVMKRRMNNNG